MPGGAGSLMNKVLSDAVKRGIVVVNVSQCLSGTVSNTYAPATALGKEGVVLGQDLTTEAALTKLAYLLALSDATPEKVAQQMTLSLRGELTEPSATSFQHPVDEKLRSHEAVLAAFGYAIASGELSTVKDMLDSSKAWILDKADYMGNTVVHMAAATADEEILKLLLLHGASVHIRNNLQQTPLSIAVQVRLETNAELLRSAGAHG